MENKPRTSPCRITIHNIPSHPQDRAWQIWDGYLHWWSSYEEDEGFMYSIVLPLPTFSRPGEEVGWGELPFALPAFQSGGKIHKAPRTKKSHETRMKIQLKILPMISKLLQGCRLMLPLACSGSCLPAELQMLSSAGEHQPGDSLLWSPLHLGWLRSLRWKLLSKLSSKFTQKGRRELFFFF